MARTDNIESVEGVPAKNAVSRLGFWSATSMAILATISLGIGVTTPPRSGPFAAPGSAIAYPYSDAAQFVPRDFFWMYPALLMLLAFLILAACVSERADKQRRIFGTIGLCLNSISFGVLAIAYFIQLQTVQPGLRMGEGPALAVVTQYNPHGVFIAFENLGYLAMGLAFAFLALSLGSLRIERAARWVLLVSSALLIFAFVAMWVNFGLDLGYWFEVTAISIGWLTLIVAGVLLALLFARPQAA